ncbi:MAG: hypothetical protein NTW14_09525, partial [bacterium]|nr:hypothetical protein [bacterium]
MRNLMISVLLVLTVPVLLLAAPVPNKAPATNLPVFTGDEVVNAPVAAPPYNTLPQIDAVDLVGDTFTIGTTWYDIQANGTQGRSIVKDASGGFHFTWMNGLVSGAATRRVYYNYVTGTAQTWPAAGIQVDNGIRGGFTCMDQAYDGIAFHAFHETSSGQPVIHSAIANDLAPHTGAFLTWPITSTTPMDSLIWPRMQIGHLNNRLHFVSTQNTAAAGATQCQYYSYGTFNSGTSTITYPSPMWTFIDTTMTVAVDVGTSNTSDKMAFAWTRPRLSYGGTAYTQFNNDIYYLIDADGLNPNFSQKINLTNFVPPNLSYLPDTTRADMDTLRAYTDANVFIDNSDYVHIAFTTPMFYELEGLISTASSLIWHWSSQFPTEFKMIANGYSDSIYAAPGAWKRTVQRPSMGQAANGNLYCAYQKHINTSTSISQGGFPSGDIFISVSTDGGHNWSVGTNVTNTATAQSAAPGACWSEIEPTMAKVVDNYCHLNYVLDKDAGWVVQTEGAWTLNPVKYHRVPVASIPTTPLLLQNVPLHVTAPPPPMYMDVTITPVNPPIVIPANGGSFQYDINAHNLTTVQRTFSIWNKIKTPSGSYIQVFGPVTRTLPGGASPTRRLTQNVAATVPAGINTYISYIGTYPSTIQDSSYFTFTKNATADGGPWITDNKCEGDLF